MSVFIVLFGVAVSVLSMMHGTAVQSKMGTEELTEEDSSKLMASLENDRSLYYGGIIVALVGMLLSVL